MKQAYVETSFRAESLRLIEIMNRIVDDYVSQGYRLTVRQLYYQLVARAIIENTERSYKRTTSLVNDARMAGLMDWDAIEDRTRSFIRKGRWDNGSQILRTCARQFHMDMWKNQKTRVFCIVEKEALAGVLEPVCNEYDIPLLAARGYPSGTVLREFAEKDIIDSVDIGQDIVILHLGDHDPSGIDMTRDLTERISLFSGSDIYLNRIALTMEQIEDQKPPPNPAKSTDSRFEDYRAKFGSKSWELDALQPRFLSDLVAKQALKYIDPDGWVHRKVQIDMIKDRMGDLAAEFEDQENDNE